jgi:tight adherence protein C
MAFLHADNLTLLSSLIDFKALTPFALFGVFAVAAWWLLEKMAARKPRAEERLDEFKDPRKRKGFTGSSEGSGRAEGVAKMLEKASPALAKPLQPKSDLEVSKLKQKLAVGGFRSESAPTIFLGIKFSALVAGLFLSGGWMLFTNGFTQDTLIYTVGIAGIMFYLPEFVLGFLSSRRKEQIFLGLPDALDLLVVCVEAGLGLDQAMRKVADEMKKSYRVVSEEFGLSNFQLQVGRTREEVLRELALRTDVDDLRALSAILIQADKFGASIAQALRTQSDAMRVRRRQIAEEKAAKTAVKLLFPLVLFIFPGIFVILVGPAAINVINQMLPMMTGTG